MSTAGNKGVFINACSFLIHRQQFRNIINGILFTLFKFYSQISKYFLIHSINQNGDLIKDFLTVFHTGLFPYPRITIGICLYFCTINVCMLQIHMILCKNVCIYVCKYLLYGSSQFISDKISECSKSRCFHFIQKIHVSNIIMTELLNFAQRTNAILHKSKEYHFKQFLFITSWTACFVAFLYKIS